MLFNLIFVPLYVVRCQPRQGLPLHRPAPVRAHGHEGDRAAGYVCVPSASAEGAIAAQGGQESADALVTLHASTWQEK